MGVHVCVCFHPMGLTLCVVCMWDGLVKYGEYFKIIKTNILQFQHPTIAVYYRSLKCILFLGELRKYQFVCVLMHRSIAMGTHYL